MKHKRERLAEYLTGLLEGKFTLRQVSGFTGYSAVHLCNLKKRFRAEGESCLINGHTGKPGARAIPPETREKIVEIYKSDFEGFNFHFFSKALAEFYGINYSYRTIYKILATAEIVSPEKHRAKKEKPVHRPRYRRDREGELIQVDATPFRWFSWCGDNRLYALHGAIDDASEKITGLCITENECSYGYYDVLEQTFLRFGMPAEIYSDRSSIFCVTPKNKANLTIQEELAGLHEKRTQWQRILDDFGIKQVLAWSPQAKGRIERLWRTLQGRLPWYFKRNRIKTPEEANRFLREEYPVIFNREFALVRNKSAAWRDAPANASEMLCSKFRRRVNSAGILSFQGYRFAVKGAHCTGEYVDLCVFKDSVKALFRGRFFSVELQDDLSDCVGDQMSGALKDILSRYMFSDVRKISA